MRNSKEGQHRFKKWDFLGHIDRVRHVKIRGNKFVSASWDGRIRIGEEPKLLKHLDSHQLSVYGIEVLNDLLISCSSDFIGVWDWKEGVLLQKVKEHSHGFDVHRLQVCKNRIITRSYDGTVRIRDMLSKDIDLIFQEKLSKGQLFDVNVQNEGNGGMWAR